MSSLLDRILTRNLAVDDIVLYHKNLHFGRLGSLHLSSSSTPSPGVSR